MDKDEGRKQPKGGGAGEPPASSFTPEECVPQAKITYDREENPKKKFQQSPCSNKAIMTPFEFISLILSGFTLAMIVVTATVYYYQLREMSKATRASSKSADAAVEASNTAKDALKASVDFSKSQLVEMQKATAVTLIAADAAKRAAEVAEATLKATTEASQLDQRPWIDAQEVAPVVESWGTRYIVKIRNAGKTPGRIKYSSATILTWKPIPLADDYKPADDLPSTEISRMPLFADVTATIEMKLTNEMRQKSINIFGEPFYVYIDGHIEYEDVFGKTHYSHFCFFQRSNDPPGNVLNIASNRNSMD